MSLIDTAKSLTNGQNRYQLDIQGCDALLDVEHFTGREAISDTYRYQVSFTSTQQDFLPQQLLRRSATFTFTPPKNSLLALATEPTVEKRVHGVITDFKRLAGSADEAQYQVVIEPFFALLRHQIRSHRFFLNQSVPDVVDQILREHNFKGWEFEFNLKNEYPKREQINQINESDRQFIERLLSEVGIFYTFSLQQDAQTEVLHFGDRQSCYLFDKKLPLNSPSGMSDSGTLSLWELSLRHQVVEHTVKTKDYNHRQAQDTLLSVDADMTRGDGEEINYGDVYHYQQRHLSRGDKLKPDAETANFWARLDHERFLARQTLLRAKSNDPSLTPLTVLTIEDSTLPSTLPAIFQSDILITRLRFSGGRSQALTIQFDAVPYHETLCWRPVVKPRPVIAGTLMARVTSAKDNDIYAHQNEDGFYWVKFDADLDDKKMGYESMPVRLAKPYAGDTYGIHFPLIQGTEVAIAFHEGDPDRPYIAHAMHDSRHPDHVTSANNTRNVIRTPANNKLRMEDKRGEEHIKLSTEYGGKSQLNMGHLVNQGREKRGDGFELRTDSWGAIRAGKGLFISADKQESAGGDVLAMEPAISLVKGAISQLADWGEITQAHKNLQPDQKSLNEFLKKSDGLTSSAILMHAPNGIGLVTEETLLMQSAGALYSQSMGEMHISSSQKIAIDASQKISLLSQKEGVRLVSGKGPFELESHGDKLEATALKDITIQSTQGHIQLTAKNGITLGCGGGYIRISPDGQIEIHSPSRLSLKGQHVWNGPASEEFPLPELPQSVCKECLERAQANAMGAVIRE